ncbi:uncharacterized protein LOC108908942 [Anoplophora glabripennis]|uniref:uncharacterized protein LOC108908942 n=2 Tax=Anoplophora glabripennis TaxID=217634 RepID=UPI0008750FC2|nr:uncharacterized protein LOC108908942 [Anoplophora glabripennis]
MVLVLRLCFVLILVCLTKCEDAPPQAAHPSASDPSGLHNVTHQTEKKFSETVLSMLDHFKQPDPVGLPGAPIPDPMDIPNMKHSFSVGKMTFFNVKLYGLKNFRIDHINADLSAMKVEAALTIEKLDVIGNYTLSAFFSKSKGPFTVVLTKVYVVAIASLEVERKGQLEAQEMDMDIKFKDISMDFKGLGFFANMFQGVMNSVGTFVFDSIKPFVLKEANTNIRNDVNKEVKKLPQRFPNSISPFDQLIAELRRKVRDKGFDPYKVQDYNSSAGVFDIYLTHTWLYGVASFHRTKDIKFELRNKTAHMLVEVGTQRLMGTTNWDISFVAGMLSRAGTASFTVEYIRVQANASQSLDTSQHPNLDDIQVELGNIQVRFDGLGTVDYVIELAVNVIPNLLRYQIMDALEKPIRLKIQEALDQVNVERIIKENAKKLDSGKGLEGLEFL